MTSRERTALGLPPASLAGFPAYAVGADTDLFRAHARALGPWWFGNDGAGRFDLRPPRGTCYVALDPLSALRERLGPVLGGSAAVPEGVLEECVVSRLRLPVSREVADTQHRGAAAFGVTRELESTVPYAVPQAWAQAFDDAGLGGVRYGPRFTPGDSSAVALFDEQGTADWPVDADPVPAQQVPGAPAALPSPRRGDLTVVRPPRTRTTRD
ncbi:RES domain-containing protein [Pedococcus dokdonensis]|uniref:RES domain-containing protein n=1 Tax=Pedococcus dokdonensis TaxID=443156 RepID=A0A1H0NN31_9MICO|nr:RES family NAD+ phosphorylase [Pedococcus dokdonensis]SDO94172.1 RES domain-containing protein [Pedococcus dokdonensis]